MTANFSEKSFYLDAFHGTTLAFSLSVESDLDPIALNEFAGTVLELSQAGCRSLLFVQKSILNKDFDKFIAPLYSAVKNQLPISYHNQDEPGSLPHLLWQEGAMVVPIEIDVLDASTFLDEVVRLVLAWRIKRLIITQRDGGIVADGENFLAYVNPIRLEQIIAEKLGNIPNESGNILRRVQYLLNQGVGAVSLCKLLDVPLELFTYEGCGTFFSQEHYCSVRQLEIDDFSQVASLIRQGESEGYLLSRTDQEISEILLVGYGAFISVNHVAGVCCLINETYKKEQAGEVVTLYALTRFQGEGIGVQLIRHATMEAKAMGLKYLFSCTTRKRVINFFERNGFSQVDQSQLPEAKWRRYDEKRRENLVCLRLDLE